MADWLIIGVPSSAGAHHAGQERAPQALRQAGLVQRLRAAGLDVEDGGDLPGTTFTVDHEHPGARNLAAVVRVAGQVADAVAAARAAGQRPLVVGGDCTITLGVVAGFRRREPEVGLIYADGDADVGLPDSGDPGQSGIFDSMGVTHLLGGGAPELAGLAGRPPLLAPSRLAIVGADPRETDDRGRAVLAAAGVSFQEAPELIADPVAAARRALAAIEGSSAPIVVHFDVDLIDSGDLPLGNFPHYGSRVRLRDAVNCLRELCRHPALRGVVLTEVNPTHDGDGSLLARYLDAVTEVLAATDNRLFDLGNNAAGEAGRSRS
jgi:arginase